MSKEKILLNSTINYEVLGKLGITIGEYCLADAIYNLASDPAGNGWCNTGKEYFAKMLCMTKRGVHKMINRLIELDIIIKDEGTKEIKTTQKWYDNAILSYRELCSLSDGDTGNFVPSIGNLVPSSGEKKSPPIPPLYNNIYNNNIITPKIIKRGRTKFSISETEKTAEGNLNKSTVEKAINLIFQYFRENINESAVLTDVGRRKILDRMRTYKRQDLIDAIDGYSKSEWWMSRKDNCSIAWLFKFDDRVDRFIHIQGDVPVTKLNLR